jgi:putative membrane protein
MAGSKLRLAVISVVGAGLASYLLKSTGLQPILTAATAVGWRGFAVLYLYQLGLFFLLGIAWYVLIPRARRLRLSIFIWARMVRDATSDLLPFSHLGGIVLASRAATAQGMPQPLAFGSMAIDITAEMMAQIAFTAAGVVILAASTPHTSMAFSVKSSAVLALLSLASVCAAFAAFQRYGRALSSKLILRLFPNAGPVTESVVHYFQEIYRRPAKIVLSILFHCAGWVASALSTCIALYFMGIHARVWQVLAIESLVCAVRSVAFWVPNGLGVQEAAYAAIAPLFGIGAEIGLAISILKRARDIAVGVPILIVWQCSEGRRFLQVNGGAAGQGMR